MASPTALKLEALLFSEGGSLTKKRLLQLLEVSPAELAEAATELTKALEGRGLALIESETELALVVAASTAESVKKAFESEYDREIGDAGLEVLSIILYRGPSTRTRIDYIRGVNTASTIRTLTSRGLIERAPNPDDAREYLYRPTADLLAYLGVTRAQELPEYAKITSELATFEETAQSASEPFEHHDESGVGAEPQA